MHCNCMIEVAREVAAEARTKCTPLNETITTYKKITYVAKSKSIWSNQNHIQHIHGTKSNCITFSFHASHNQRTTTPDDQRESVHPI